jgi:hypothetical protein
MVKITSLRVTTTGYRLTLLIDNQTIVADTYYDCDGFDKVTIDDKTYELVGLSYLREI